MENSREKGGGFNFRSIQLSFSSVKKGQRNLQDSSKKFNEGKFQRGENKNSRGREKKVIV